MAKKKKVKDKFLLALQKYFMHFHEGFPTFEADYLENDDIIKLIDKCIEEDKKAEEFLITPYDDDAIL